MFKTEEINYLRINYILKRYNYCIATLNRVNVSFKGFKGEVMKFLLKILALSFVMMLMGGCSSSSDGNSDSSVVGYFVDDPVSGLTYECSSGTVGVTGVEGEYTCENGDDVTFSIGDVIIGTVTAEDGIVTPYTFFPSNQDAALNLARLLQSLDSDPSDDVITLDAALVASLDPNTNFSSPTFVADVESDLSITLISVQDAQTQLNETIATAGGDIPDGANIPVADAGVDQSVLTGATVNLDGSGSSDADTSDVLTYSWGMTSSPSGTTTLSNATSVNPTFTADDDGTYEIQLIVNDGSINSAPDTVVVTAATQNTAPVANAGADQSVDTGTLVTLNGSGSSDVDPLDALTYFWTVTSGSATLSSTTAENPTFTPASDGIYEISLVVNDGTVDSDNTDTVTVTATTNTTPVYGTVVSATGRTWHDRNLGATRVCESYNDAACYGDYYQWGRNADGHQLQTSATTPTQAADVTTVGNGNFITSTSAEQYDWGFVADQNGATRAANWSATDGSSVCPVGFRLPTKQELENERIAGGIYDHYSAYDSALKLPTAGARSPSDGALTRQGTVGYLWSSDVASLVGGDGVTYYYWSYYLSFYDLEASVDGDSRGGGIAVRCIQAQ